MDLILASGRRCHTQTGLPFLSEADNHPFQTPVVDGLVLQLPWSRDFTCKLSKWTRLFCHLHVTMYTSNSPVEVWLHLFTGI